MKKKAISIVLILSFLTSMIALNIPVTTQQVSDTASSDYEQHMDISIGFWDIQDMVNENEKDAVLEYIENKFNITIEPISVGWNDYQEHYRILSATKSLPDVFAALTVSSSNNNSAAQLQSFISSGSIRSIPDDLSSYPLLQASLSDFDCLRYTDGHNYALPRYSFTDDSLSSADAAMLVRKDWRTSLGISVPENLDEFINMICAFANEDPDGNGVDDTIGYNVNNVSALGKWVILGIAPECNVYSWIETPDGHYTPSYLTDSFDQVVSAYRTMYERGGLDPDFYKKKATDSLNDFASGSLGALEYKSSPATLAELQTLWDKYQTKSFEDCVEILPIFAAPDGKRYSNSSCPFWSETYFSSSVDDAKMERILSLFEYLLSDEGQALIKYGIENEDYELTNGKYHCLLNTKGSNLSTVLTEKYPSLSLFDSLASWGGTEEDFEVNEQNKLMYGESCITLSSNALKWNQQNTTTVTRPYPFLLFEKEYTNKFSSDLAFQDFIKVIIGTGDPVAMWDDIKESYEKAGIQEYIDRQNQLFQEANK